MKLNLRPVLLCSLILFAIVIFFNGCKGDKEPEANLLPEEAAFARIQEKVLNTSCAISGCHASVNDGSYAQHRLLLTADVAYQNLVGAASQNASAKTEGLLRVKAGDLEKSLLWHKINCAGSHGAHYGNTMPLGLPPLSAGKLKYISDWIKAGAPEKEKISTDAAILNDNVPACEENFTALAPPSSGYQIKVDPFPIAANFEREIFVYKEVGNTEVAYINRIEMKMRRNSHHFLVNTFAAKTPVSLKPALNQIRDLRDAAGNQQIATMLQMEYQQFTIASQTPTMAYDFPAGVALKIPANHKLDLNLHYVNKTTQPITGECYLNLHKVPASAVQFEAQPIFINNTSISLPANKRTTITKSYTTPTPMKIFMLTSHTHKLGEKFDIKIKGGTRNGELIYSSTSWEHPEIKNFSTPVELKSGEGLQIEITYNNITAKNINFGLTSEDEMGIVYGYYY